MLPDSRSSVTHLLVIREFLNFRNMRTVKLWHARVQLRETLWVLDINIVFVQTHPDSISLETTLAPRLTVDDVDNVH